MNEYETIPLLWDLKYELAVFAIIVAIMLFLLWHYAYKEGQESMRYNPPP